MRRLLVSALCAVAFAAPIPVAAVAQSGPEAVSDVAIRLAERHLERAERRAEARAEKRAARRRAAVREQRQAVAAMPPHLAAIARCESGGDPRAIGGGGAYRGMFQFDQATWESVGGTGDPAAAPAAEQIKRAAILYERAGSSPWPVCG